MNDAENPRISVDTFRKLTNDYISTIEEIEETVNSLYELSIIVYNKNNIEE
ncbi:MAG: hypothetical protein GQ540_02015 [Lutibacter sp.]|uniref:hypothetical protein n=1 Tax=Lutibacter sp. TaxID=1925666 RepID=UPI0019E1612F|nr:hypothetical protein [Lutibacter sp.]NOR27283.1 hypothetical protein [Lutibacter sp.]